jgi:transcriptional regulator with XRE-family HTH domain
MRFMLRDFREARGIEVGAMCARLGVKDSRYRKWESGTNAMPLDYAVAACGILRCTLDELVGIDAPALDPDESRLVALYRSTDARGKAAIMRTAEGESGVGRGSVDGQLPLGVTA